MNSSQHDSDILAISLRSSKRSSLQITDNDAKTGAYLTRYDHNLNQDLDNVDRANFTQQDYGL